MTIQDIIATEADRIIEQVCRERHCTKDELLGHDKQSEFVAARRAAIHALKRFGLNSSQIARALNRNPASVLYWTSKTYRASRIEQLRAYNSKRAEHVDI